MSTPYLIFSKKNCRALRPCIIENYGLIRYELPFINALSVEVPDEKISNIKKHKRVAMIARDGFVTKLPCTLHGPVVSAKELPLYTESPYNFAGKNTLAEKTGFLENKGFGTTIAIIDTGVAPHYDLVKPYNRILAFKDFLNDRPLPYDDDGHGTHVAGIAAGNGYASGRSFFPCGTAPMANIVALKALDETGSGTTSDILAAMQWIADNKEKYNIRVVNLSLGIKADSDNIIDPLVLGTAALTARGISVVTAAGNSGPEPFTVTSPGTNPLVITVGSCDKQKIPAFSSRGPTYAGIHKPDMVAPGVDIISLDAKTCKKYIKQSGTSMSCPYVSGAVACLYSEHPGLTPRQIKNLLTKMLTPLPGLSRDSQGRGALYL